MPGHSACAAIVALSGVSLLVLSYTKLINKEAEVIDVSEHLASEMLYVNHV